ncbi:hypothetical protein GCM10023340_41020 [Nocardioides marinquilinus]|uniref:GNAT family N-acetyltransferase n=1 Tax=Nocardioides marinquilinus TaxID=1210400 RepID=A0ABP9Q1E7_9ACTN
MAEPDVRPLTPADLDWVADLAGARRAALVEHAPRFWRPAADAAARHRAFLGHLIADDATVGLRTDRGFVLAVPGRRRAVVDDWAVADPAAWAVDGVALLTALREALPGEAWVRVVGAAAETERLAAAAVVGLEPAEVWWHRDLPPTRVLGEPGAIGLSTPGTTGRLVPAPPVYDPGGPVLLVTATDSAEALAAVETEAARRGATVSVVSQRPDDLGTELLLVGAGYTRTSVFLEPPAGPAPA